MIFLLVPLVVIGPVLSPFIFLATLILLLAGVFWSPFATILSCWQQNRREGNVEYHAPYVAILSILLLVPWIYYFCETGGHTPSFRLIRIFYYILYAGWILGPFIVITLIGVAFPAFIFIESAQYLISRDAWPTIAKWLVLLLVSSLASALCAYTWFASRRELLAHVNEMEKSDPVDAGDTLDYPYLKPFVYCTAWTVVATIGIPLSILLQLVFSFEA